MKGIAGRLLPAILAGGLALAAGAANAQKPEQPKLVVGIIVDQMRFDYLYKYYDRYGKNGFRRLIADGYQCKNLKYNYVPTYTGPGHSSVYTGTTPAYHGIVSNDWIDIQTGKSVYCASDNTVSTVGSSTVKVGKMSPANLLSTTIGDELRLSGNMQSRVFGVALKDRASILPAGHLANAAYWFDGASGNWVSSTYYMQELPKWLEKYNASQPAMKYLNGSWETLYPVDSYKASLPDSNPYEKKFKGRESSVFPYNLKELMEQNGGQEIIKATPFGNSITREMAQLLIEQENLGKGKFTDMLCVSFSSTDYVGHSFGTDAVETEDTYLRLDQEIATLLDFLDARYGRSGYLLFLTADHGGANVPKYLMDMHVPGGYMDYGPVLTQAQEIVKSVIGRDSGVVAITNDQIYLQPDVIKKSGKTMREVEDALAEELLGVNGILSTSTAWDMQHYEYTGGVRSLIANGYYAKRSGHVMMSPEPNWIEYDTTGTTHGSPYSYDTRVPMIWFGYTISKGETPLPYYINDIAPTISWLLNIPFPNACSGNPIPLPINTE
ncbi:MAG: alkaline phosphatase family protein [Bacteroidetes bacterium]|nr:alkaline phosphatase family protein [Bacteroidota bacterium]